MKSEFNKIGISDELDIPRIKHLLKIGFFAAIIVLAGDILIGYGAADSDIAGIPVTFARYLSVSDGRLFWAAILGMIGIPIECLCYFAVYRLIAPKSAKYAHAYRAGIFGCMIFGACGVHVPCSAAVYFLKKMYAQNPDTALDEALKFILYFMLPATVLFLIFFAVLNITQIAAVAKGLTPLPKWAWIFNVLFGILAAAIFKLPNLPLTNGLAAGWISLGNFWTFGGLLIMLEKNGAKK
ncbi:MAG: hypothetical protein NC203_03885 [Firmicutes bacterium]|nr:hypothetical protein [[Eubacterium] siraeum]MCM1487488.1 hypothetical protein [Bacillota bacterium]